MPIDRNTCIEYAGAKTRQGYGTRSFRGVTTLAHRAAWIIAKGEIPEGLCILHKCDNPPCVNVEHLFLGTYADNNIDCSLKGRNKASRNRGASHAKSKITEQTAIRMKMLHGVIPARVVAEWLGLNAAWAGAIMRGDQWKHVTAQTRYGV